VVQEIEAYLVVGADAGQGGIGRGGVIVVVGGGLTALAMVSSSMQSVGA
jgi:hypothetical protein